jgi:nitrogenase molybdenum-iron protein alpha/beta subunit
MNISINPLKKSQVLGATLAVLGFNKFMPLHHGSQGCTAFIKNLLTQHFRETTPMQTTAVFNVSAIMGSYSEVVEGLKIVIDSSKPAAVCIITTSLTQLRGDDVRIAINDFRKIHPEYSDIEIFVLPATDFEDDAEIGFADATLTIIDTIEFENVQDNYLMVFGNFSLTPADIDEIKYITELFDLKILFFPDLSETLGSINNFYYKLPTGGSIYRKTFKKPIAAVGIGNSTRKILQNLNKKGINTKIFPSLTGLKNTDDFIDFLYLITGKKPHKRLINQRNRLIDTMLDSHFYLCGFKVAIAAEPDLLYSTYSFLAKELGIDIIKSVTTSEREDLDELIEDYTRGDLFDFEKTAKNAHLILTNSNGELISEKYNIHHYNIGFPIKNEIAYPLKKFIGYEGSLYLLRDIANVALKYMEDKSYSYKHYKGVKYESCIL